MDKWQEVAEVLSNGRVAVIPTDTIYGIVGQALNKQTVERIHKIKGRSANKPFIVLISSIDQLSQLGISINWAKQAKEYWPGPNSLILSVEKNLEHLTLGQNTLAVRLPDNQDLINLINRTGPLVAPSANPECLEPSNKIDQAIAYFGDQIDCYLDGGILNNPPSKLIDLKTGHRLR